MPGVPNAAARHRNQHRTDSRTSFALVMRLAVFREGWRRGRGFRRLPRGKHPGINSLGLTLGKIDEPERASPYLGCRKLG
jgi:hypothetical protein